MLRLSHSGLSPTGDLTFEHSTFFSLLNDENLYRPSDIESKATMELMTRIYTKTLTRAWGPQLEDKRKESPDPPETGNTSNTTYQYSEGTQSSDNSLGSYEWGDVLEDLELLRADGLSVDAPASPGPGPQRHDEPLDTASPDKRVHFDHSTFATSNQTVETARPKTRSATRISQGNETNSQSASSSGPRAPDTGPPGPSTQEASTSGARERERKKTNGPGGTRRPVALEANATRTTTTRPKTTRTATSQTASTRAIDTQSNSGVAVVRSTRSTGSTANAPSGRSTANANVPAADGDGDGPSMAGPSRPRRAGARYDAPTKSSKAKSTATKAKDAVKASGSGTDTMDRKGKKRLREEVNLEPDEPPDRQESPPKKKKR
ncbi:hypothetical protein PENSPDRAFT_645737 [Peniophora sp. CONT]|nr:hypothetical protein PENSPDRAFT_645737 [Peniophora sp. CONT]